MCDNSHTVILLQGLPLNPQKIKAEPSLKLKRKHPILPFWGVKLGVSALIY